MVIDAYSVTLHFIFEIKIDNVLQSLTATGHYHIISHLHEVKSYEDVPEVTFTFSAVLLNSAVFSTVFCLRVDDIAFLFIRL